MRNFKRFLAMTLTLLMAVSCFSFASFAQSYDDVYDYAEAIDVLSNLQIVEGYEDGTFGPDNAVERWHMSLWIAKMETGKVPASEYLSVWKAEQNYTDFTDVNVDQYMGAINYAADEGIIIGTTATTFSPTAGITYQDALTMVVRALGYGSKTMDAGYPWKYINKASELGLEDGISGIAYTDVLTRAETAQILYNALYTVDADGDTYIADVFGLTTVVITGTPAYKIIETESVIKTDYVSFNVLNADGTINDDVTYHLPATAFGIEAAKADTYVGASFKVTTDDNFKTFGTVIANPSEVFDAAKIVGKGTPADPNGKLVTLGDKSYEAVTKYSTLYNAQGIKGNTPEILVYKTNLTQKSTDGYFKVDSNYNVLDKDGKIVAYYAPSITGSYAAPYAKRLGNDAYTVFLNNSEIITAGGVWYGITSSEYAQTTNTYDLVKNNKYATATAYDDNADGVYDRLFYTYEEFCNIYADANTPAVGNDYVTDDGTVVVNKFIDGKTGEALATAPAGYIRYSYNPLSKYLTVYENYTYGTGLVTTVNTTARKIVIGGTQYTYGIDTFKGATADKTDINTGLVGKQVNFILVDGVVVQVLDAASAATYIVFDNLTGLTTQGYATALVYVQSNQASVITIATINGYSYQNYMLTANHGSLGNITDNIETGTLFTGTKDALGFWHLTEVEDYTYLAFKESHKDEHKDNKDYDYCNPDNEIYFENGIANTNDRFYYDGRNYGTLKSFSQFNTNANTLYIVYNEHGDRFYTAKGIPVDGAKISIDEAMFVSIVNDASTNGPTATFVYVYDGSLEGNYQTNAWSSYEYDTIIYVDYNSAETLVTNDLGNGNLLGYTNQYGRVLDMINGKWINVQTLYSTKLEPECFYTVSNGYVEEKLEPYSANSDIQEGLLKEYGTFYSIIEPKMGGNDVEDSAYTYLFKLDSNGNVVFDAATGALINFNTASLTSYVPVYYYDGPQRGSRVLLCLGEPNVVAQYPMAAEALKTGVAGTTPNLYYTPYKFAPNTYTALDATERNEVNYYIVPESLYLALSAHNTRDKYTWETINDNTYDSWMRIYDANGVEVENWEADFTALLDNVTIGSSIVRAPIYTIALRTSSNNVYSELPIGVYTIIFKYNNDVYKVFVKIQLTDVPTLLNGLNALIYDVDMYNGNAIGQDGTMDTGRIFLKAGAGFSAANYQDDFEIEVYAIPYYNIHWDSLHGNWRTLQPRTLVLEDGLVPIWNDDFRFDVNGEAVIDMLGRFVQSRDFECSAPNCSYEEDLGYGWWNMEDGYYYAMKVTSKETGEVKFITEFDWENGFVGQKVTFAPSFDVKVTETSASTADVKVSLDEFWASFDFAAANTTMKLSEQFKFNLWGSGTAYDINIDTVATPASQLVAAATGYTWKIKTDPNSADSTDIFDQHPEFLKNFAFSWSGQAYHSYQGTYTYPTFAFGYVLPFAPIEYIPQPPIG